MLQIYTKPGSYYLELVGSDHTDDFARAADLAVKPDPAEVEDFCRRLSVLKGDKYLEIIDQVIDLELPAGYLHVRVFDEADLFEFASLVTHQQEPPSAADVTMLVTLHDKFLEGRWVATRHLGDIDPGVLDLAIRFEPRDRALEQWEID